MKNNIKIKLEKLQRITHEKQNHSKKEKEKKKEQTEIDFSERSAPNLPTEFKFVSNSRLHDTEFSQKEKRKRKP